MIVIGDVHGCYTTLMKLMEKLPKDKVNAKEVVFVGDLIDRGPDSNLVIDFVRKNDFPCVLGNHEQMFINYFTENSPFNDIYFHPRNGGRETVNSYNKSYRTPEKVMETILDDIAWLKTLPTYLMYNVQDKNLVVTHSSVGNVWKCKDTRPDIFDHEALWSRRGMPNEIENVYNVFGHTIVKKPNIEDHFANIDTGCVFKGEHGYLTALQFPDMIVYQQRNIEKENNCYADKS